MAEIGLRLLNKRYLSRDFNIREIPSPNALSVLGFFMDSSSSVTDVLSLTIKNIRKF